ncbi:MAG: hypothetical protein OEX07_15075 [Gammaproteobacteria bacterium]|nr:hypothetical protein [Gammaproteobacteria bacterium]
MTKTNENKIALKYQLKFDDGNCFEYEFIDEDKLTLKQAENPPLENWMKLSHHQCENCPLTEKSHPICPVANNLYGLLKDWEKVISYDKVDLIVTSRQRTISANTTAQKALSSLLGLIMATSDCPHTHFFRAMAKFHLPLASNEETSFRAISTFFMMQYFQASEEKSVNLNLENLRKIYDNMHTVNVHMKQRLENAVIEDAALNAVVILDLFAISMPYYLEDELEKLRDLFA